MVPHLLALGLLFAPPTLGQRLSLGVLPLDAQPAQGSPFGSEIAAAAGGVLLGHGVSIGLAFAADRVLPRPCHGDVCDLQTDDFIVFGLGELIAVPLLASALAYAVRHGDQGSFLQGWIGAALGHLGGAALVALGALLVAASPVVGATFMVVALVGDLVITSVGASIGLHHSDVEVAPTSIVAPPPPLPPQLQPPPRAGLMLPLHLAF